MLAGSKIAAAAAAGIVLSVSIPSGVAAAGDPRWRVAETPVVEVDTLGGEATPDGQANGMLLSRDGRLAVWNTAATNWTVQDANGDLGDVLMRNLHTGELRLVDTSSDGEQADGYTTVQDFTPDGRYVLLRSTASNLAELASERVGQHLFRKDMVTGEVAVADVDTAGRLSNNGIMQAAVSRNGRYVAFTTQNAFPVRDYGVLLYLRDMELGTTTLVNERLDGQPVRDEVAISRFFVSDDGRHVTFDAQLAGGVENIDYMPEGSPFREWGSRVTHEDVVERGLAFKVGIYRRDMTTKQYDFLSVNEQGEAAPASSIWTQTADGRYIFVLESGSNTDRTLPRIDTSTGERRRFDLYDNEAAMYIGSHPGDIHASDDGGRLLFSIEGENVVRDDRAGATYNVRQHPWGGSLDFSGDGRFIGVQGVRSSTGGGLSYPVVRAMPETDVTPPSVTGVADRAPDSNNWHNAPVTITWSVEDPEPSSGISATPAPTILSADGRDQTVTSDAVCDAAGNCARGTHGLLSIDTTPPSVTIDGVVEARDYILGAVPTPSCSADDRLSGVEGGCSLSVSGGNDNGVGAYTVTASAEDAAGNVGTETVHYRVVYAFSGFLQPIDPTGVSVFKAGSTVPVTFALTDANGNPVATTRAPEWLTPQQGGPLTLAVDEAVYTDPPDSGTAYQGIGDHWRYNWRSPSTAAGYHWRMGVRLDDGTTRYVTVGLR